ncbi:triose-phosphate isomerase [Tenuifilum thalassicum]|uniref:Triosephosphate isomerase n=1 Tax=Tenuifilum thalassicum TaxID=2590900 RepID=A0A7D3Y0D5_9BACT|nr:triose-phosphate isomerase [Tenuifilum thalassicum]QKG80413.1 triose-phosphate isomerase [Tenuifilum thalassicum]
MRKKIVAGNWKMNTLPVEGLALAKDVISSSAGVPNDVELVVIPPFTHLNEVSKLASGTRVAVGAQNCARWEKGAYTGEVSASMLKALGLKYVIVGHSERREYFGETNQHLFEKIVLAHKHDLIPIFCCGEKLQERESNTHFDVVKVQVEEALFKLDESSIKNVVIAYEPVWAIGTGKTATAEQAQEMHAYIRKLLADKYGNDVANSISILYGGSCKPSNAAEIFAKPDVDGGLIGGASLVASDFVAIAKSF